MSACLRLCLAVVLFLSFRVIAQDSPLEKAECLRSAKSHLASCNQIEKFIEKLNCLKEAIAELQGCIGDATVSVTPSAPDLDQSSFDLFSEGDCILIAEGNQPTESYVVDNQILVSYPNCGTMESPIDLEPLMPEE